MSLDIAFIQNLHIITIMREQDCIVGIHHLIPKLQPSLQYVDKCCPSIRNLLPVLCSWCQCDVKIVCGSPGPHLGADTQRRACAKVLLDFGYTHDKCV